jgi:hypothetical protein
MAKSQSVASPGPVCWGTSLEPVWDQSGAPVWDYSGARLGWDQSGVRLSAWLAGHSGPSLGSGTSLWAESGARLGWGQSGVSLSGCWLATLGQVWGLSGAGPNLWSVWGQHRAGQSAISLGPVWGTALGTA